MMQPLCGGRRLMSRIAGTLLLIISFRLPLFVSAEDRLSIENQNQLWSRLAAWMEEHCDAKGLDNIAVQEFDKGGQKVRGLALTVDLPTGGLVVSLKKNCWFGPATLPQRYAALQKSAKACEDNQYVMALWLADEFRKGNASSWHPFLSSMPSLEDFSRFHPAILDKALAKHSTACKDQGSGACETSWKLPESMNYWSSWLNYVRGCYNEYVSHFEQNSDWTTGLPAEEPGRRELQAPLSFDDLAIAYLKVMTRDFDEVGCTPVLDLANTDDVTNVHQYYEDENEDAFSFYTLVDMKAGDELFVDYAQGSKDPLIFFSQYGFSLKPDTHTSADIDCSFAEDASLYASSNPIAQNYARFARVHCPDEYQALNSPAGEEL